MTRRLPPFVAHWLRKLVPALTRRVRRAEVARVRQVEEVGAELQPLSSRRGACSSGCRSRCCRCRRRAGCCGRRCRRAAQLAVVRRGDRAGGQGGEERVAVRAQGEQLLDRQVHDVGRRDDVRARGVADGRGDAAERAGRVGAVQRREGRAALEGEEAVELPAAEDVADEAALLLEPRQLVDEVAREPVRPVVGRARAVEATVVRSPARPRSRRASC